jgi:GT2 family glycosyltransferase
MRITAVILSYKNFDTTTKICLDTLLPEAEKNDIKVLVVDNASPDDSAEKLIRYHQDHPLFELQLNKENLGFTGGFNSTAGKVDCDWFVIVDSDAAFPPNSLKHLTEAINLAGENDCIISPLTNNAGTCQHLLFPNNNQNEIFELQKVITATAPDKLINIYRADFFCVAIKKLLWDKLNGLSLDYGRGYYEDFDFCMRAKKLGYQSVVFEKWFVYHQGSAIFKSDPAQKQLIKKNKKIFLSKYPGVELRHRRLDIYLQIKNYLFDGIKLPSPLLLNRINYLQQDNPRSMIKRWLWKRKVKKLLQKI